MDKLTAYIAGPMSGKEDYNFPAFDAEQERQEDLGFRVINPANNFERNTGLPWEMYLARCAKQLLTLNVNKVVVLPGWEESKGVCVEYLIARSLGIPIYDTSGLEVKQYEWENIVSEAWAICYNDREQQYGHPKADMERQSWLATTNGIAILSEQIPIFMIYVKLSRESHRHKKDNLIDICGYALVYRRIKER